MRENVDVEFKELDRKTGKLPDSIQKEIISFANTEGGEIYIGIRDDGSVSGVDNPDDVMNRISNIVHDTILPDAMSFIQIRTIEKEGKPVVVITVSVGTERPYYLAKEGLKPKGVFVRRGSACVPLNESGIRQMILETSGKSFEESRSLNQNLTFEALQAELQERNMEFGTEQMKTLKFIGEDNLFTNLALLLSDQCVHTIKTAVFQGTDNAVFRDRKEFSGSLLKQLEEVYHFLSMYNKTEAHFDGLQRKDYRDYPEEAIREALLNSIIHRDYLFSGSTIINVFDDHIEFISLGGLVSGISMDAVFMGASQSRNPNLASLFYRLGLVESYGTGVRKILRLYKDFRQEPVFRSVEGAFCVEMMNRNGSPAKRDVLQTDNVGRKNSILEVEKEELYRLVKEKGDMTRKDVEEVFGVGSTKAYKMLKQLCEEGQLVQKMNGKKTTYHVV